MSVPLWTLLGFAVWTVLTVFGSIGVYRWSLILTGRASISQWRADEPQGAAWYRRAMRAHMNCVENLSVYAAIVFVISASGASGAALDALAVVVLAARIGQTLVHIAFEQTNTLVSFRFALYIAQAGCMLAMAALVALR